MNQYPGLAYNTRRLPSTLSPSVNNEPIARRIREARLLTTASDEHVLKRAALGSPEALAELEHRTRPSPTAAPPCPARPR